ncbi:hypothetical protein CsatA_025931 [Cannabis sativa]
MVKALCDNLMAQDSESFKDNNSNNESYESCLNIVEAPSDEYIEETEPRIEEKESFEVVENLDTLDACSTNDELNSVNEETSILNDEIIEDQIIVKDVDGHEETEQPIERLFKKSKKEVPLVVEESLVVVDLRLSTPLYYEPPMDPYFPLMPHSPYCSLFELPKASPQAHHPKSYVVGADFCSNSSLAKLEGEYNNNFQVVLHDAYYGRQPLVDVAREEGSSVSTINLFSSRVFQENIWNVAKKAFDPISILLSSLVAKGLISASKTELPAVISLEVSPQTQKKSQTVTSTGFVPLSSVSASPVFSTHLSQNLIPVLPINQLGD